MTIYIDSRAGSKDLIDISPLDTCSELLDILPYGDVLILGKGPGTNVRKIGIEVKSLPDFIQSIITNRLTATQLPRMFDSCDYVYVMVYGMRRTHKGELQISTDGGTRWNKAYGGKLAHEQTFMSIAAKLEAVGCHVHSFNTVNELAIAIHTLYTGWQKRWESHTLFEGFDTSNRPSRNDRAGILPKFSTDAEYNIALTASILPDVGSKTFLLASKHFTSVYDMLTASRKRWKQIPGVGNITFEKICRFVLEGEPGLKGK